MKNDGEVDMDYPKKMNDAMKKAFADAGIDPFSCVVIDKDERKEEQVFVNENYLTAGPPKIDLASGKACSWGAMEFQGNPICWEFRCGRYGCGWYPYPCR